VQFGDATKEDNKWCVGPHQLLTIQCVQISAELLNTSGTRDEPTCALLLVWRHCGTQPGPETEPACLYSGAVSRSV